MGLHIGYKCKCQQNLICSLLNQSQGGMYIEVAMMISWVALVNRSHPYLENGPAP